MPFEQAVFQGQIGRQLLQRHSCGTQIFRCARIDLARGVTSQPLLAGIEKLPRPTEIKALSDTFVAAQTGDAVLATKLRQHDPDLLFRRVQLTRRRWTPVTTCSAEALVVTDLAVTFYSMWDRDEPQTLRYVITPNPFTGPEDRDPGRYFPLRQRSIIDPEIASIGKRTSAAPFSATARGMP